MDKNYYEILEVDKHASEEIIKKAYNTLAKKYHPDANNGQNKYQDDSFEDLQTSYKLLLRLNG